MKVLLSVIHKKITLAEVQKKHGVYLNWIGEWKHTTIAKIVSGFERVKSDGTCAPEAKIEKLHSKIGELVVK